MNFGDISKNIKIPEREPDHQTVRGVKYWWSPEWIVLLGESTLHRIAPIRGTDNKVRLCHVFKDGSVKPMTGSLQDMFQKWHEDREIDWILLGINEEEILTPGWLGK